MGSLSLLQGIFPTQGWNPGLSLCRQAWVYTYTDSIGFPGTKHNRTSSIKKALHISKEAVTLSLLIIPPHPGYC